MERGRGSQDWKEMVQVGVGQRAGTEPGPANHLLGDPEPLNPYLLHRVVGGLKGITKREKSVL